MGFVTKEKLFSKDFFITYGWLLGGCFVFALGAVLFAEPYGFLLPGEHTVCRWYFIICGGWETEIACPLYGCAFVVVGNLFPRRNVWCENHHLYVCYSGIYAFDSLCLRL